MPAPLNPTPKKSTHHPAPLREVFRLYDGVKSPDEAAAKVRNEFVPVISKIPGFQQYYAVKTGDATIASVSVFKDKPGADESVQAAKKWVQQNLSEFLPNPPQVISGDTVAHAAA